MPTCSSSATPTGPGRPSIPDRYAALMRFSGPHAAACSPEGLAAARAATTELRQVIGRCAAAGLVADRDVDRLATPWRAVAHGLAEFENRGLLPDGDQAWHSVLAAIIDGYGVPADTS